MAGVSVEAQRLAQDPLCAWRDYGGGYLWPYCEACENWMSAGHATCRRHVNKLHSYGHHALAAAAGAGYTAAQAAGAECPAHGPAAQAAGAGYPAAQAAGAGDPAAQAAGAGGQARGAGPAETYSLVADDSPSHSSAGCVVELIDVGVQTNRAAPLLQLDCSVQTDPWQWPLPSQWQQNPWQWQDPWQWQKMEPESPQVCTHSQSSTEPHKQWPCQ